MKNTRIAVTILTTTQIGDSTWREERETKIFSEDSTIKEITAWIKKVDVNAKLSSAVISEIKNNKKSNMYNFVDNTISPLSGACIHKCNYCYANSLKKRFPVIRKKYTGDPQIDKKVLGKNLGKGKFYFVQSMSDLFADNVKKSDIIEIFEWCKKYPDNKYLFQTKNPKRFLEFPKEIYPKNSILVTTIETNRSIDDISKAPDIFNRIYHFRKLISQKYPFERQITIEPVIDFNPWKFAQLIKTCEPSQVNVGVDSGNNNLPEPSKEELMELIFFLEKFTNVHLKKNLNRLMK